MPPITSFPIGNLSGQQPTVHVRDNSTSADLYERNADTVNDYVASTTKLMVAIIVHENKSSVLDSGTVTVTAADVTQPIPPFTVDFIGLAANDVVTWRDLLKALLLASAGDAGQAMARVVGDGLSGGGGVARFVTEMNTKAGVLGLTNTTFTDVFGGGKTVSANPATRNQSTARDLSKLCTAALAIGDLRTIVGTPSASISITGGRTTSLTATNYNRFINGPTDNQSGISDDNVLGGKNGVWVIPGDSVTQYSLTQIWTAPNGNEIVFSVVGSASLLCLQFDMQGLIYSIIKDWDYLTDGYNTGGDASFASVQMLVGADGSIVDESSAARTLTVNSVTIGSPIIFRDDPSSGSGVYNDQGDYGYAADAASLRTGASDDIKELWFTGDGTAPGGGTEYVFAAKAEHTPSVHREWLFNYLSGVFSVFASSDGVNWTNTSAFSLTADERSTFFNGATRHIAMVKDGSANVMYINGERSANSVSIGTLAGTAAPVVIGYAASAASFKGSFDDFRYTIGTSRGFTVNKVTLDARNFPRSVDPPPPPPPPAGASDVRHKYVEPLFPIRTIQFARLTPAAKLSIRLPREAPIDFDVAAAATNIQFVPYAHGPRRDGPFAHKLPQYTAPLVYQANPPPEPDAGIVPPFVPAISLTEPHVRFHFAPRPVAAAANPATLQPPPPPGPPPPPPPDTGVIGPQRGSEWLPSIPRAPRTTDDRLRPFIDKVSSLLNSLERRGFIVQDERGEYQIIGGGFALFRAPAVTDDMTVGAVVGGTFVDRSTGKVYICVDNAVDSAIWREVT